MPDGKYIFDLVVFKTRSVQKYYAEEKKFTIYLLLIKKFSKKKSFHNYLYVIFKLI